MLHRLKSEVFFVRIKNEIMNIYRDYLINPSNYNTLALTLIDWFGDESLRSKSGLLLNFVISICV